MKSFRPRYPHPFLECDHHPGPQLSYIICKHVLYQGADPVHVLDASATEIGEILCAKCQALLPKLDKRSLAVCCRGCAIEHGHIGIPV